MRLQKASLFALYAILELANDPERQLSTVEISEKYGISPHHLAKVMRVLVRSNLVQAVRGVGGGYRFSGNPSRITLLDVIQLFESLESLLDFPEDQQSDPIVAELQSISGEIDVLTKAILNTTTLKTALNSIHKRIEKNAEPPKAADG